MSRKYDMTELRVFANDVKLLSLRLMKRSTADSSGPTART